jgi:hypothetical protein
MAVCMIMHKTIVENEQGQHEDFEYEECGEDREAQSR